MTLFNRLIRHRSFFPATWKRTYHLHEYQSKELLTKYGVNTQPFKVGSTVEELTEAFRSVQRSEELTSAQETELVIKAQILAGGRGKGTFLHSKLEGGVQLVKDIQKVGPLVSQMLRDRLVTCQTSSNGVLVKKIMIAAAVTIVKEAYFAIVLDRKSLGPIVIASPVGGIDIESVALANPELIFTESIDIEKGLLDEQAENIAIKIGFGESNVLKQEAIDQMKRLYNVFIQTDSLQVEVNPLALTSTQKVMAIDAKIQIDDNASFRQTEVHFQRDTGEDDPREVAASKHSLNYIGLDGSIGCLVNGAGLAMATMDIIKLVGGEPANFLDVGGNANAGQVKEAFKILSSDPTVRVILVNIFGGIMRCDIIAHGILSAMKEINLHVPLVVRLSGTNMEKGKRLLIESGLSIFTADDMESAALRSQNLVLHPELPNNLDSEENTLFSLA